MQNRLRIVQVNSGDENISATEYKNAKDQALVKAQNEIFDKGCAFIHSFTNDLFPKFTAEVIKNAKGEESDVDAAANKALDKLDEARDCLNKLIKGSQAYIELNNAILKSVKAMDNIGNKLDEVDLTKEKMVSSGNTQSSPQLPSITNNQSSLYQSQSSASRTRSEVVTENKNGGCCVVM